MEFSQWPVPNKTEDIPRIVEEVTSSFLRQARASTEFGVASEKYSIEQFVGEQCQGSFVTFEMTGYRTNMVEAIFVMSVGGKLWNGQFSGPSDAWRQALTVLRGVKHG